MGKLDDYFNSIEQNKQQQEENPGVKRAKEIIDRFAADPETAGHLDEIQKYLTSVMSRSESMPSKNNEPIETPQPHKTVPVENHKDREEKIERLKEEINTTLEGGFVKHQEFPQKIQYFQNGKTSFESTGDEMDTFSYNPANGEVLPSAAGWRYALTNPQYLLGEAFDIDFTGNPSINELVFKPAKIDKNGRIIERGEIKQG